MLLPRIALAAVLLSASSLTLPLSAGAQVSGGDWQLVLLKPPGCRSCTFAEEMLRRRGFLQRAELNATGGHSITARVVRRPTSELTPVERRELAALPYFNADVWARDTSEQAAQVLLLRDGHVASAGSLADSSDLRNAQLPEEVLVPALDADPLQVRGAHDNAYQQAFLRNWNFDYFFELALNPRLQEQRTMSAYIAARPQSLAASLPSRNLILLSTATWPGNNEIFNATRIAEIQKAAMEQLAVPEASISVLYGGGNPSVANAVEVRQGRLVFARQQIPGARPATLPNLISVFQGLPHGSPSRNLFVLVGHGGPDGAGLWGQIASLQPDDLAALHQSGKGDDVIVSGNCFGGVMARAMSCGFFAARPDIIATGCQADAAEVAQSRDYLKMFFAAVTPEEKARADADHDGSVSFEEAHWFASVSGDTRNITYTTLDSLADEWFARHPQDLPARLSIGELQKLAGQAPPAEQLAVRRMTDGLTAAVEFSLQDLAQQANAWSHLQVGVRPMIAQLARRLLYVQRHAAGDVQVAEVRACEARPVAKFLAP